MASSEQKRALFNLAVIGIVAIVVAGLWGYRQFDGSGSDGDFAASHPAAEDVAPGAVSESGGGEDLSGGSEPEAGEPNRRQFETGLQNEGEAHFDSDGFSELVKARIEGTIESPWGLNQPVTLRLKRLDRLAGLQDHSEWQITVSEPRDLTALILAEADQAKIEAAGGQEALKDVGFVGFDVRWKLLSPDTVALSPATQSHEWEFLGGHSKLSYGLSNHEEFPHPCPIDFDDGRSYTQLLAGGIYSSTVCIPVPIDDIGHSNSKVVLSGLVAGSNESFYFQRDGEEPSGIFSAETLYSGSEVPTSFSRETAEALGSLKNPYLFETNVEAVVPESSYVDSAGTTWQINVETPRDITLEVLSTNEYLAAPPDDVLWLGFDVSMTLLQSPHQEPVLADPAFEWKWVSFSNRRVQSEYTPSQGSICLLSAGAFSEAPKATTGATLKATVCFAIPKDEFFGDPNTNGQAQQGTYAIGLSIADGDQLYFTPS